MARVNLDGKVWKDPRVKRLVKLTGWSLREVVGTLAAIWDVASDSRSELMTPLDVDTVAERDGFVGLMVSAGLASEVGAEVRLNGLKERIDYLLDQASRGRSGGIARGYSAKQTPGGTEANAKHLPSLRQASAKLPPSVRLAVASAPEAVPKPPPDTPPDLDHALDRDLQRGEGESERETGTQIAPAKPSPPPVPKPKRGSVLSAEWRPHEREIAKLKGYGVTDQTTIADFVDRFRAHWKSTGVAKKDWDATFRTWIIGDALRGRLPKPANGSQPAHVMSYARQEQERLDAKERDGPPTEKRQFDLLEY